MLHQIGAGTAGPVFHAQDLQRDRLVAVKLFTVDLAPDRVRHLVAEFERLITADLAHPGIAATVATGIAGGSAYLAYELVDAESLEAAIREYGPAPAAEARRIATQIAGALDFAAAANIVHGALHPRDVLLPPGEVRLTGLGVARALEHAGVSVPIRHPYSAPERGRRAAWDRRADVFTLAVLVYELLWGRQITGTVAHAVAALPEVEGGDLAVLRKVFSRALTDRPEDRFPTALEFAEAVASAFPAGGAAATGRPPVATVAAGGAQPVAGEAPRSAARPEPRAQASSMQSGGTLDLDLRAADRSHDRRAAVTPAPTPLVGAATSKGPGVAGAPASTHQPSAFVIRSPQPSAAPARSRSAWALAAVLVLGVGLGFAMGYRFKTVDEPAPAVENSSTPAPSAPAPKITPEPPASTPAASGPAAREFTESAIPKPPPPPTPSGATVGRTTPQPAAPEAVEGRLLIRSEPAGATVIVDGREYGTTPAVVRGLDRGTHRIRVVREGYIPEERSIAITRAQPAPSLVVTLEARRPAAERVSQLPPLSAPTIETYTGALVVESLPPGATVYVDNRAVGKTPLTLNRVNAGEHVVRLERDGYHRWSRSVRVVATERNRVTASLER